MNSWQSLLFYLVCFSLSAWFIYLGSRENAPQWSIGINSKKIAISPWNIAGILIPILIGCLRYGMGTDYASYLEIYQYFADGQVVDWHISYIQTIEPMFQWLASMSHELTNTPLLFFGTAWSATILFVYFGIKRWVPELNSKAFAATWLLALPIVTAIGFNQIRQMLAIAILFFASSYIIKLNPKNVSLFLAFTVGAVLCHRSAIAMAMIFLAIRLSAKDSSRRTSVGYITMRIIIISTMLLGAIIIGASINGLTLPYVSELSRLVFVNGSISGNILGIADIRPENIILLCIFLPTIFFVLPKETGSNYVRIKMLSIFCIVGVWLTLISVFVMNGERLAQYFVMFPVAIYYLYLSNRTRLRATAYPIATFFLITFLGWQGMLPYYTIYDKDVDVNAINSLSVRPPYNQLLCKTRLISCNNQTYFDAIIRERYEYEKGYLWELK